ncbi:MAG TPA: serine hydrolase domain-containing protein [Phenylobacterium sp.]
MSTPEFEHWVDLFADPASPGVSVGVELRGRRIFEATRGLANLEWREPVNSQSVFRIASLTKQFTAAAIVHLSENGRLGLDDAIARHLPQFGPAGAKITLRHLLNHTSGIGDYTSDPGFMARQVRNEHSTAELIEIISGLPSDFEPGARCLYSNSGYVLLGAIVEACAGVQYADYVQETFFKPLGLTSTRYLHDHEVVPMRASGYSRLPELRNAPMIAMSNPHAAGGLGSTASDLLSWSAALRGGRVVSAAGYSSMTTPARPADGGDLTRGFGLFRHTVRGDVVIAHSGSIFGFAAHLAHWPAHDLAVAALANSDPFPIEQLAYGLARRALGQRDAAYAPLAIGRGTLASSEGRFVFPNAEVLDLSQSHGGLASSFPRLGSLFRPYGEDRFFLADDPEVTFRFTDETRRAVILQDYRTSMTGTRAELLEQ